MKLFCKFELCQDDDTTVSKQSMTFHVEQLKPDVYAYRGIWSGMEVAVAEVLIEAENEYGVEDTEDAAV